MSICAQLPVAAEDDVVVVVVERPSVGVEVVVAVKDVNPLDVPALLAVAPKLNPDDEAGAAAVVEAVVVAPKAGAPRLSDGADVVAVGAARLKMTTFTINDLLNS